MAASNAPKHDFAPAWLKIPSDTKPAGSKSTSNPQDRSRQRRDENFFNRYGPDYPRQLNRQNSFDLYDASKRCSPSHGSKYRHHSVEDDYYYYGYGYYNYPYDAAYPMEFGSQPSIPRPSSREIKYPLPPSRYSQMNGSYPGYYYYDFYPQGEGYTQYSSPTHSSKRANYGREGRGESKESQDSDRSHDEDDKEKNFNDDFPSLNGMDEDSEAKPSKNTGSAGVWDNPLRSKFDDASDLKNSSAGFYKALIPSKPAAATSSRKGGRDIMRVNGSLRDLSPLASFKSTPVSSSTSSREAQQQSPTPPIEILSSRLVRQPKTLGDKKSEFLKALRKEADSDGSATNGVSGGYYHENNNNKRKAEKGLTEVVTNGMSDLHLDHDLEHHPKANSSILSSSLEAEQRLLREMGWDEQDDEVYEITEDDKREFKQLTDKLQQQRNGFTRMLPKAWSPQHIAPYKPQPQELNETLSSSDSDEDEDV